MSAAPGAFENVATGPPEVLAGFDFAFFLLDLALVPALLALSLAADFFAFAIANSDLLY